MLETVKTYDFIIVGSGIGGLVSANILAMEGYSVLVLEKNHQIGGNLQVFSRDQCIFDTGVHYIGGLDKGQNLHQIFKYLGIIDELNIHRLDDHGFDRIIFSDGREYKHAHGYECFIKSLLVDFPDELEAINNFCDKVKEICDYFPLYNLRNKNEGKSYITHPEILSINAWDYVSSITSDKRLRSVLLGNSLLYAGDRRTTPFYIVALILNSYLSGSYRMINGGSQIARELTKKIHNLGGEILKHQHVCKANYSKGKIVSVETKTGEIFHGKTFISNIHPKLTVNIFGENKFRPAYVNRLNKNKNTISTFMLHLSFKDFSFEYLNHNVYVHKIDNVLDAVEYNKNIWPESLYISTSVSKNQGKWAESMSVMTYMNYDEFKKWGNSFNTVAEFGERGAEYEDFKKNKEQIVINEVEKMFPRIRDSIKGIYSSTPLTYRDYIGTDDGSLYGILKDSNNIDKSKIHSKTHIPNLFQTGQNIVFHGILGSTISSLVTCFNFIDDKKLLSKINNA
ncbi:MAG: all-trans-retinol 13,14-reductase [Crocinitomicaceae bacterium]|nr:all-trans-retinol 13,14-reductase [Crocinitomicaceae bacterium]|tara:strand:- start:23940 stop:25469 length:1530 start_codon:yes stop_codon:yes gene_type:complete